MAIRIFNEVLMVVAKAIILAFSILFVVAFMLASSVNKNARLNISKTGWIYVNFNSGASMRWRAW